MDLKTAGAPGGVELAPTSGGVTRSHPEPPGATRSRGIALSFTTTPNANDSVEDPDCDF